MKAYISISYQHRQSSEEIIAAIKQTLAQFNILPFVFVDQYNFPLNEEKEMMEQAVKDIEDCDLFIAETSKKAIGIGVEAGYAKAKNKPVIYLRNQTAEHSTTVAGISDFQVIYKDEAALKKLLAEVLQKVFK